MINNNPNINYTTQNDLCLGCGICADACPTKSISISTDNGEYRPLVNDKTCINNKGCYRCSKICPGIGIKLSYIAEEKFSSQVGLKSHPLIGLYTRSFSGYAKDHDVRYHGASGGLLTAFIAFLLDNHFISAAVVANNDFSVTFLNKTILVHNSKDLFKARSSKYCPVSFESISNQIKDEAGQVVIVGLPCVIQGFRKLELIDSKFRSKVFGYFGLYCSCGRTFNLTEYTFKHLDIDKNTISYFQYRDNGCLGELVARDKNHEVQEPFELYYHPLRSFFIPNRCQLCIDHYSELADISFGDIHYGRYKDDKVGINSIVVRNDKFVSLLEDAEEQGYIHIDDLSEEELVKCQASAPKKKGRVGGVLKFRKAIGLKNPEYDVELTKFVYWKSIAYYLFAKCQMFVGKRRWLWWIIPLISKKGHIS
jgi:coenzyme F420 hydrogenase subunit beta